ncbi:MAG: VOC family protein [Chrysiogenales bacterium]|nr:MAG: VOC family protein [Chrysiogenales bacterium]
MPFNEISPEARSLLEKLRLPPFSQIGITVPDIRKGVRCYGVLLGIPRWYRTVITRVEYFYRGSPIDQKLDIAVGYSGKMQVELIEVSGADENIYTGTLGFHHLGVTVGDMDRRLEAMEHAGITPVQTGTIAFGRGGVTRFAYLDTMTIAGFILELIETRAFGINLGMPRWLVSLGRLTGDTRSIDPSEEEGI